MGQCRLHLWRKQITVFVAIIHHAIYFIYFIFTLVLHISVEDMEMTVWGEDNKKDFD